VWPAAKTLLVATSTFLFLNLVLVAGLGRRVTTLRFVEQLRLAAGIDLAVIVAVLHAALLILIFVWMARPSSPPPQPAPAS
jgi:hypothetical protein